MAEIFDLESLIHVEQTFYDSGYAEAFAHGRIHGLIEGRAMGREKGFEMWEELGFYEGFALMWKAIYIKQGRENDRAVHHIKHLLELISQFPRVNPSPSIDFDVAKLFRQIRSRYKALCSTLGVRPSLRASDTTSPEDHDESLDVQGAADNSGGKRPVWNLENGAKRTSDEGLNF